MSTDDQQQTDSRVEQLANRVDELEEQVDDLAVEDPNGQKITLGSLLDLGLTRRQAMAAMGLVAGGSTIGVAVLKSIGTATAQEGNNAITGIEQLGEPDNRIGPIYASELDVDTFTQNTDNIVTDSLETDELSNVVDTFVSPADDLVSVLESASTDDVIYLEKGTHEIGAAPNITGVDDITIEGTGPASVIEETAADYGLYFENANGVTLRNFKLVGATSDPTSSGSNTETAIAFQDNCDNATIQNVWIENWGYDGIHALRNCFAHNYDNVRVKDVGDDGINPGGLTLESGDDPADETVISNCVVERANNDAYHISEASERTILSGNRSINCGVSIGLFNAKRLIIDGHISRMDGHGLQTHADGGQDIGHISASGFLVDDPDNEGVLIEHGEQFDIEARVINADNRSVWINGPVPNVTLDVESIDPTGIGVHVSASNEGIEQKLKLTGRFEGGSVGVRTRNASPNIENLTMDGVSDDGLVVAVPDLTEFAGSIESVVVNGGISGDLVFLRNVTGMSVRGVTSKNTSASTLISEADNADENIVMGCNLDGSISLVGANSTATDNIDRTA